MDQPTHPVKSDRPLLRIKTLQECQVTDETTKVFVAELPSKYTKTAVDTINNILPEKNKTLKFLFYLRRVCLIDDLPETLKTQLSPITPTSPGSLASPSVPSSPSPPSSPIISQTSPSLSRPSSPASTGSVAVSRRSRRRRAHGNNGEKSPDSQSRPKFKLLWLLLCPVDIITQEKLSEEMYEAFKAHPDYPTPRISVIDVPKFSPSSPGLAKRWSAQYWPCVFKNSNPYGPNPSDVKRMEGELYHGNSVHHWMRLAQRVAEEGRSHGLGESIGAVVIERSEEFGIRVVSVAADARRCGVPHRNGEEDTNIMGHAVMRAIGLVGQKRRVVDNKPGSRSPGYLSEPGSPTCSAPVVGSPVRVASPELADRDIKRARNRRNTSFQRSSDESGATEASDQTSFVTGSSQTGNSTASFFADILPPPPKAETPYLDNPMTFLEAHFFAPNSLQTRGYLCLNLEVYTTHEPCIMCSMALLHSRVSRVVFGREMPLTGGLVVKRKVPAPLNPDGSEIQGGPRYGLFWRSELNWKFLCWQYGGGPEDDDAEEENETEDLPKQLAHLSLDAERHGASSFEFAKVDEKMHA